MHVVATAGHVDHGKSTLVRALTGMEPDRWAEEKRRGMTIDLGFAWTTLPTGEQIGFVDVPGHQRFLGNMLAGLGPVPAVLFVVAADEGWCRQSVEHLAAIDGLGLRHGLLAVTRSDLADPAAATAQALEELRHSSLGDVSAVAVSGRTGLGLDALRQELSLLVRRTPDPDPSAAVRLWVDRAFTVRGAGTVVTGTLEAGTLSVGQAVRLRGRDITVRGLQSLGSDRSSVPAVARIAINLRGVDRDEVGRGDVLLTGNWQATDCVDVRLSVPEVTEQLVLHIGTASLPVRVRPLTHHAARLQLPQLLPLRAGDRGLLRDPAGQKLAAAVVVLDPQPPTLVGRGAAARRGAELLSSATETRSAGPWLVSRSQWDAWLRALARSVDRQAAAHPLDPGLPADRLFRDLNLPAEAVLTELVHDAGLVVSHGRVHRPGALPAFGRAEASLRLLEQRFEAGPFEAPSREELDALKLSREHLAAARRSGRLLVLGDVVLPPYATAVAVQRLADLPAPFAVADARAVLGTRRAVAVALLEHLDAVGLTARLSGGVRRVVSAPGGSSPPSS